MTTGLPAVLRGDTRRPGGTPGAATVTLTEDGFTIAPASGPSWSAGYRDVRTLLVDGGTVLVELGDGAAPERWMFERFGTMTGLLARGIRDGRLRQRLTDGLVELDQGAEIEMVEYAVGAEAGVAQLAYHDRGVVLAPIDERLAWRRVRRADIGGAELDPTHGGVAISTAGRSLAAAADGGPALRLLRLGAPAKGHRDRWAALRDGAAADAAAIVAALIPDAPFAVRQAASGLLLEGHPIGPGELGDGWAILEAATLGHPPFDESYGVLREIGGGGTAPRWLAAAPERPGNPEAPKIWFFVGLPGNLVAMELVSAGAHATYLFRVVPRSAWAGATVVGILETAVADISEALIDARFLREPIALPAARLAEPPGLRYRMALAALPSLAGARARFVARIVHRDAASWRAAIEDVVAWHGLARDDAAEWPGRAAQEAQVDDASGGN